MIYKNIDREELPDKRYNEMGFSEAETLLEWLRRNCDIRIANLQILIDGTSRVHFSLDFSTKSLLSLGKWLKETIETRPISEAEVLEITSEMPEWVKDAMDIPTTRLTEKSISISFDVAIYFALVLLRNNSELKCSVHKGSKLDVNHNQPAVLGFKYSPFNPYQVIATGAVPGIADGSDSTDRLFELYSIWSEMIEK